MRNIWKSAKHRLADRVSWTTLALVFILCYIVSITIGSPMCVVVLSVAIVAFILYKAVREWIK